MRWRRLCARLEIATTPEQAAAMDELESRGMTFCGNFGTENAVQLLEGMNCAMDGGFLYDWLRVHMGVA